MSRILIAEDEDGVRLLLQQIALDRGHEVDEASNGKEAHHRLLESAYDLVVCDIKMPEWDGMQVIQAAARDRPAIRFLVVSAYLSPEMRATLEKAPNVLGYMEKPFDTGELGRVIDAFSGGFRAT